jgi:hypothetical protein
MVAAVFFMEDNEKSFFSTIEVWRKTAFAFNVDCHIIVDETDKKEYANWSDQYKESHVVKTIKDALKIHPKNKKVLLKPKVKTKLKDFKHPKNNVTYIFGPDGHSIDVKADYEVDIGIDTELWAIQAYSIVLYDRSIK